MTLATKLAADVAATLAAPLDAIVTFESVFGSNLIDLWYPADAALSGTDVTSLTGQLYGLALTPSGTAYPTYNASDANFNGKPSISCFQTGNKYLRNNALPTDFAPAGNRPFVWAVGRWREAQPFATVADQCGLALREAGGSWDNTVRGIYNGQIAARVYVGANYFSYSGVYNTSAHLIGGHVHGTNGSSVCFDGALLDSKPAGNAALPGALDVIWIGANGVGSEAGNFDFAVAGVCLNPPTADEIAAAYQVAARDFGI